MNSLGAVHTVKGAMPVLRAPTRPEAGSIRTRRGMWGTNANLFLGNRAGFGRTTGSAQSVRAGRCRRPGSTLNTGTDLAQ